MHVNGVPSLSDQLLKLNLYREELGTPCMQMRERWVRSEVEKERLKQAGIRKATR